MEKSTLETFRHNLLTMFLWTSKLHSLFLEGIKDANCKLYAIRFDQKPLLEDVSLDEKKEILENFKFQILYREKGDQYFIRLDTRATNFLSQKKYKNYPDFPIVLSPKFVFFLFPMLVQGENSDTLNSWEDNVVWGNCNQILWFATLTFASVLVFLTLDRFVLFSGKKIFIAVKIIASICLLFDLSPVIYCDDQNYWLKIAYTAISFINLFFCCFFFLFNLIDQKKV